MAIAAVTVELSAHGGCFAVIGRRTFDVFRDVGCMLAWREVCIIRSFNRQSDTLYNRQAGLIYLDLGASDENETRLSNEGAQCVIHLVSRLAKVKQLRQCQIGIWN